MYYTHYVMLFGNLNDLIKYKNNIEKLNEEKQKYFFENKFGETKKSVHDNVCLYIYRFYIN